MKALFCGGPEHGKVMEIAATQSSFLIPVPVRDFMDDDGGFGTKFRTFHYVRSRALAHGIEIRAFLPTEYTLGDEKSNAALQSALESGAAKLAFRAGELSA